MNILNRRMFAEGDVANAQPQPRMDIPKLIEYYVSQGYNSVDIKEMLPQVSFQEIESLVGALGGSLNPAIASPGANEFTGDINPFLQIPETATIANAEGMTTINPSFPVGAASPELPSEDDISLIPEDIRRYIQAASKVLDDEGLVQGLKISFDLSEEEARNMIGMSLKPSTDIDMIDPSRPSPQDLLTIDDGLPEISDIGTSSELGANQYRNAEGKLFTIDPVKFKEVLMSENIKELEALIQNPDVEYGPALQEVFRQIVGKRKAGFSSTSPSTFEFGEFLPDPLSLRSGFEDAGGFALDYGKQMVEGVGNLFGGFMSDRDGVQDTFPSERFDFNKDTYFSDPTIGFSPSGNKRKGYTNDALDGIILRSSLGEIDQSLEEIAAEEAKPIEEKVPEVIPGETPTKEETPTTDDDATGTSTDPVTTGADPDTKAEKEEDDIPGITPSTPNDEAEQLLTVFDKVGGFINSDANLRMMRNVGKGLTQYGNFAEGIGIGAAAASEERVLEEQLEKERQAKITEELIKAGKGVSLKPSDIKGLNLMAEELNTNVGFFEGGEASIAIMNDTISLFEEAVDKGVKITGLPGRFERFKDEAAAFAGYDKEASPATKIQNMIEQVKQRSIRAILQESGRTISDTDRDIVNRVFGDLDLTSPPGEILKKLKNARQSLVTSNIDKRNTISTTYKLIQNPSYGNVGTDAISSYKDLLETIINSEDYSFNNPIILGNIKLDRSPAGIFLDTTK